MNTDDLLQKLQYQFQQIELLKKALTHRSYGEQNNERLEFLGDAVLGLVVAEMLYQHFSTAQEGALSRWRATLVNRESVASLARQMDLGRYLYLGQGELKSGGSQRESILSCAMEAVIGAIYLDGGFGAAEVCIKKWYDPLLQQLSSVSSNQKDPKTLLQEYLQKKQVDLPHYVVESVEGKTHEQQFVVSCFVSAFNKKTLGKGTTRRRAEQEAAQIMLRTVTDE